MSVQTAKYKIEAIPLVEIGTTLVAKSDADIIAPNRFTTSGFVKDNKDLDRPFAYRLFDVNYCPKEILMKMDGICLCQSFQIQVSELKSDLISRVYRDIKSLSHPRYEIWHRNHNVSDEVHFGDPFGHATELLDLLRSKVHVIEPKVNHNKVSSKPEDRFDLNHMHLDSFEGMRRTVDGARQPIDRYFFNLDSRDRDILIAGFSPKVIDQLVSIDYEENLLTPLFSVCDYKVPLLRFRTPAADYDHGMVFGLKILSTHVIHGEYGPKGDMLAIVNTLPI